MTDKPVKKKTAQDIAKILDQQVTSSKEGAMSLMSEETLIFILDCSSSMNSHMGRMKKFGAMIEAASKMLEARNTSQESHHDLVGIVAFGAGQGGFNFGADVKLVAYPSLVTDKMVKSVTQLRCAGGTPMFTALKKGMETLDQSTVGLGRLVLLSDGQPTDGSPAQILAYIENICEETGFVLDTVGIGDPNSRRGYDEPFMKLLAQKGGGQFFRCDQAEELAERLLNMESERRALLGSGVLLLGEGS